VLPHPPCIKRDFSEKAKRNYLENMYEKIPKVKYNILTYFSFIDGFHV